MKLRIVGIERNRLLKIGNGFVERRQLNVADAQILVNGGVVRVLRESALEVVEGLFAFAGQGQRQAKIGERRRIARFALDGFLKPWNRVLLASQALQCHGHFKRKAGEIRVDLDGCVELLNRIFILAGSRESAAVLQQRFGVWRIHCGRYRQGIQCG